MQAEDASRIIEEKAGADHLSNSKFGTDGNQQSMSVSAQLLAWSIRHWIAIQLDKTKMNIENFIPQVSSDNLLP